MIENVGIKTGNRGLQQQTDDENLRILGLIKLLTKKGYIAAGD